MDSNETNDYNDQNSEPNLEVQAEAISLPDTTEKKPMNSFILFLALILILGMGGYFAYEYFMDVEEFESYEPFPLPGEKEDDKPNMGDLFYRFHTAEIGMTKEQIDEIFTPHEEKEQGIVIYEKGAVTVQFNEHDELAFRIELSLPNNAPEFRSSTTDLTQAGELSERLLNQEHITYNDLVLSFGNNGICIEKRAEGCRIYSWADINDNYMRGTINPDGSVLSLIGTT